jgi:tetratricopeptide (TPR) repeat protein
MMLRRKEWMTVDAPQHDEFAPDQEDEKNVRPQPSVPPSAGPTPNNYQKRERPAFTKTLHEFAALPASGLLATPTGTHQPFQENPTATGSNPPSVPSNPMATDSNTSYGPSNPAATEANTPYVQSSPTATDSNPAYEQSTSFTDSYASPESQTSSFTHSYPGHETQHPQETDAIAPVDVVHYEYEDESGQVASEDYALQHDETESLSSSVDLTFGLASGADLSAYPTSAPADGGANQRDARPERNLAASITAKNRQKEVKSALSQALERDKAWLEKKDQPLERQVLDAQLLARKSGEAEPSLQDLTQISRTAFAGTIGKTPKEAPPPSFQERAVDVIARYPIPLGAAVIVMIASVLFVNLQSLQAASKLVQQGADSLSHGDTRGAIVSLDKAIQLNSSAIDAYMFRGKAYSRLGNDDKALSDYKEVLNRDSKNLEALEQSADINLGNEQYQSAVNYYQDYLKYAGPRATADAYEGLGRAYVELQQYPMALDVLNRAIDLSKNSAQARMLRARCFLRMNKSADAVKDASAAVKLDPKSYQALLIRGRANQAAGNKDNALADFSAAVALAPKNSMPYTSRANFFASQRDFPKAFQDFAKALSLNPKDADIYQQRAKCYVDQGDTSKAEQDLQTVEAMPGFHPSVAFTLARADIFKRAGEYDKAIDLLKKAQSKDSQREADYLMHIADCHAALKQYGKAAAACVRVLALQPKNADAVLKHGQYSYLAGNKVSGQADLFKAIELAPSNPNAYLQRGNYYLAEKEYTSASNDFKKALSLDPDLAAAKENLELCSAQLKHPKISSGDKSSSESESESGVTKAERKELAELDAKALQTKGYDALKAGRNQYAVAAFTQAVKLNPNLAILRRYLATALLSIGDGASAVEQFKAWMKLEHVSLNDQIAFAKDLFTAGDAAHSQSLFASIIAGTTDPAELLNIASTCAALHFDEQAKAAIDKGLKTATEPIRSQLLTLQASLGKPGSTAAPQTDSQAPVRKM